MRGGSPTWRRHLPLSPSHRRQPPRRLRFQALFSVPAGEYCAFPLQFSVLDGSKLHKDSSALFSTGPLSVTITNLDSGAAQTFNVSGPTFRDGTLTGKALVGQPLSRGVGPAFLLINSGRVTFTDNNTIDTITGSRIDVCSVLS